MKKIFLIYVLGLFVILCLYLLCKPELFVLLSELVLLMIILILEKFSGVNKKRLFFELVIFCLFIGIALYMYFSYPSGLRPMILICGIAPLLIATYRAGQKIK